MPGPPQSTVAPRVFGKCFFSSIDYCSAPACSRYHSPVAGIESGPPASAVSGDRPELPEPGTGIPLRTAGNSRHCTGFVLLAGFAVGRL